jgi:hypothetical protein
MHLLSRSRPAKYKAHKKKACRFFGVFPLLNRRWELCVSVPPSPLNPGVGSTRQRLFAPVPGIRYHLACHRSLEVCRRIACL